MAELKELNQVYRASYWSMICVSSRAHADHNGAGCLPESRSLMQSVLERLCDQPPPTSAGELMLRYEQQASLQSLINAIADADSMVRQHPSIAAQVFAAAKRLCELDFLPTGGGVAIQCQIIAFNSTLATIRDAQSVRQFAP